MIHGWPKRSPRFCARLLATVSICPPALCATMKCTGLPGYATPCACAAAEHARQSVSAARKLEVARMVRLPFVQPPIPGGHAMLVDLEVTAASRDQHEALARS